MRDKSCGHVILYTQVACNTLSFEIIILPFPLSLCCRYSSLRRLSNASLSILLFLVQLNLLCPSSNLGKLCHMFSVILTIQRPYMALQENFVTFFPWHWLSNDRIWHSRKTSSNSFRDTDDPTTVYGTPGKLRHILSTTLTIQRPYMALQENFVACYSWHWRSNDRIW